MKIYRAYITYNNGDYNEWEETYRAESPWYTTREEAEKHFFELAICDLRGSKPKDPKATEELVAYLNNLIL